MATGGTGDVLTGMLSGLIAQYGSGVVGRRSASACIFTASRETLPTRMSGEAPLMATRFDPRDSARLPAVLLPSAAVASREIVTHSSEETIQFGREIGAQLKPPVLDSAFGRAGAGKTTLTKGIVSGAGRGARGRSHQPHFYARAQI